MALKYHYLSSAPIQLSSQRDVDLGFWGRVLTGCGALCAHSKQSARLHQTPRHDLQLLNVDAVCYVSRLVVLGAGARGSSDSATGTERRARMRAWPA